MPFCSVGSSLGRLEIPTLSISAFSSFVGGLLAGAELRQDRDRKIHQSTSARIITAKPAPTPIPAVAPAEIPVLVPLNGDSEGPLVVIANNDDEELPELPVVTIGT
jgi:hypothetical protein